MSDTTRQAAGLQWRTQLCGCKSWSKSTRRLRNFLLLLIGDPTADPGQGLSAVWGVNLSVRDATKTIPTFCPGFSRASRVVGRPADYRRVLSAVVGIRDWCPDRAAYFKLYRSVFRRFGSSFSDRNGFGWALWTSEFCGLSSSLEQDCRRLDTSADAPLILCHLLARGTRLPARCQKLPAEGDAYMAGLCVSDAGYVFSDFGTRITQTAGYRTG